LNSNIPAYIDNADGGVGAREKLLALGKRDVDVNPEFDKGTEKVVATTTPDTTKKETVKEEPVKDTTTAAKDDKKTEKPPETTDTTPQKAAPPVVSVQMDMGFKLDYLSSNWPIPAQPAIPGMEFLTGAFDFLNHFQISFAIDFHVMFWDIIGLGVESGLRYNTILTVVPAIPPSVGMVHFFWLPALVDLRFTLGPVFIQPYGGVVYPAIIAFGIFLMSNVPFYEAGIKAGLRLGNIIIFVDASLMSPSLDMLFTGAAMFQIGGGLLFKIF